MDTREDLENQIEIAMDMSESELLQALGATASGNASIQEAKALGGLLVDGDSHKTVMIQHDFSANRLIKLGEALFAKMWPRAKGLVCHAYRGKTQINDKDLATYLVGLIVAALSISNAVAILLVTLAIKRGLDLLCPSQT